MGKLVKAIALLCSIYNVNFGTLVEDQELVVGGNLIGTEGSVRAHSLYNVQRDQNDDDAEYDVLGSDVLKHMAKVLREVMNPGAHR